MKGQKKLGEILIDGGLLTQEQLRQALVSKRNTKLKLGEFLVRQGILRESQLIDFLSEQLKIEKYRPEKYPLDLSLTNVIPADIAQKHQVVPLMRKANLLTIGVTDPLDIRALDTVEAVTNIEVEPVICAEQQLNQLIGSLYGAYSDLDDVLESIQQVKYGETDIEVEKGGEDVQVSSLQDMAEEAPIVRLANSILSQAVRERASDVHISPEKNYVQVRFRVDGRLHEVPVPPKSMFLPIVSRLKILANMDIAVSRIPQDGRFTVKTQNREINIRASTIPTIHGENLVLRLLDSSGGVYSLEQLGMSQGDMEKIESLIVKPFGMILSTGPTGSGKTTSLYSILKKINKPDVNIITLEDPVEYRIEKIRQVQLNRRAGMTFASGLRSILRQDPDVIMVGEIRDAETATIAVQAALTGHRVLSTVHTNDAAGAITRLLDMGIEPFLVSSVLLVSFAQRLVRMICPNCKESYRPPKEALAHFGMNNLEGSNFMRGKGCFNCLNTGYKGRTGIFEVLPMDEMIEEMILKRRSAQEITRAVQHAGRLRTLQEDAADKVRRGITTLEEAASAVMG
ncbi:MAG: Flp pilus assembly complex ATPase component TadA [Deltaproteobacteria bacterium]|nr:Flp pilus assembly complex ATPase component TadA [Deltaproteobacteria bacterium]MBW1910991.1 Flp pilus assembly complex ATPase component TadA [Deltaproteobacteria bacterium]MBW2035260.1 Flp pilus assembly complex ATPase component TadA [Deltaproteobacteria bacterium]